jgi:MoxR-like ATPase
MKLKRTIRMKQELAAINVEETVERLTFAFADIEKGVVGRTEVLKAVMYAMLCGEHIMLDGRPGVAKTLIAESCFNVIRSTKDEPVNVFSTQLMRNTSAEQIFGVLDLEAYKKEKVWRYAVKGFLPTAHFAFLDELYRANDGTLTSMMGLLNERMFHNAGERIQCPLRTAIATTNFVSDEEEVEAFSDRWLIRLPVDPLAESQRMRLLEHFIASKPIEIDPENQLLLSEFDTLRAHVKKVIVPEEFKELYTQMVTEYARSVTGGAYVSDRRFCKAFRLLQAAIMLEKDRSDISPDVLVVPAMAILRDPSNKEHKDAMARSVSKHVGTYVTTVKERAEIEHIEKSISSTVNKYDPANSADRLRKSFQIATSILESFALETSTLANTSTASARFTHKPYNVRFENALKNLRSFVLTVEDDLKKRGSKLQP